MKRILAISLAALVAASCAPADPVEVAERAERDAMELEEAVRGRVAGDPVSCVNLRDLQGNRSAGEGAVIFDGPGNLVYVNRPPAGCPELRDGRTLVIRTPSTRMCRGDIVSVVDPLSRSSYGSCGLGDFIPYRRVE